MPVNTREDSFPSRTDGNVALEQLSNLIVYHRWWLFIGVSSFLQIQVIEGILLRSLQEETESANSPHSPSKLRGKQKMSHPIPPPPKRRLVIYDLNFYFLSASATVLEYEESKFRNRGFLA